MVIDIPKNLYKYRSFDNDGYNIDSVYHTYLFFSSPSLLNDPFDCKIPIRFDKLSLEKLTANARLHLSNSEVGLHPNKIEKKAKKIAGEFFLNRDSRMRDFLPNFSQYVNQNIGICSFSEEKNNNVLWSQYADSFKGFLIEYDGDEIRNCLFNYNKSLMVEHKSPKFFFVEVEYVDKMPLVEPMMQNKPDIQNYLKHFSIKSIDWKFEKEFRLISFYASNIRLTIPHHCISRIIAGISISERNLDLLKNACDRHNIDLKLASKPEYSFKSKY